MAVCVLCRKREQSDGGFICDECRKGWWTFAVLWMIGVMYYR